MFPIENEIFRDWFLESFPDIPCGENFVSTIDSEPFSENAFDELLRAGGLQLYDVDEDTDVLIVGRNFGLDEEDEEIFNDILSMRKDKPLRVYSQEMFLAHWFSGRDPFEDEDVAISFVEGHPALELISTRWFGWVSTLVKLGDGGKGLFIEAPSTGVLGYLGYKVGKQGLSEPERRAILTDAFNSKLPDIDSREYMQGWGQPKSKERLMKMANSIASFCRNQKKLGHDLAASHYEEDLEWLRKKFYVGRFNFSWAKTYVE